MCIRTNLRHASRQEPTFGPAVGTWWGATVSGFNIWRVEWGTYTHHHSFIRPYLQDIHGGRSHPKVVSVTWRSQYEKSKTGGVQSSSRFSRSLIQPHPVVCCMVAQNGGWAWEPRVRRRATDQCKIQVPIVVRSFSPQDRSPFRSIFR